MCSIIRFRHFISRLVNRLSLICMRRKDCRLTSMRPAVWSMSASSGAEPESFRRRLNSSLASSYEMMTLFSLVPL